jgi:hypothetical protein
MDRAMIVTVLWRLAGKPAATSPAAFGDVKAGSYYYDAVAWATENGIVKGRSGGIFDPGTYVTRQEIAVFLFRYAKYKGENMDKSSTLAGYTDNGDIAEWANEAMAWIVGDGIITGSNSALAPQNAAKRSEFAAMLYRYCN